MGTNRFRRRRDAECDFRFRQFSQNLKVTNEVRQRNGPTVVETIQMVSNVSPNWITRNDG